MALAIGLAGCQSPRKAPDHVMQGQHGPTSPAESAEHGALAFNPAEKTSNEYATAGLDGEVTNGKVDETMEGSGNLAWQGTYEREKRAKAQAQ